MTLVWSLKKKMAVSFLVCSIKMGQTPHVLDGKASLTFNEDTQMVMRTKLSPLSYSILLRICRKL